MTKSAFCHWQNADYPIFKTFEYNVAGNEIVRILSLTKCGLWGWALTTTLSISTLLKNTLSKVSFSNLLTNDFLDHPKASEKKFYFYTFDFYTFENYTFESVVVSAHTLRIWWFFKVKVRCIYYCLLHFEKYIKKLGKMSSKFFRPPLGMAAS